MRADVIGSVPSWTQLPLTSKEDRSTMPTRRSCDYLVIGAGATGMAFCQEVVDTTVILVDQHDQPGGQWLDVYSFCQLHQPSAMYGVRTEALGDSKKHRATKEQVVAYYGKLVEKWTQERNFLFVGGVTFDFQQVPSTEYQVGDYTIQVKKRVVDARFLQPDIPIRVPPKFDMADPIQCVPVNDLVHVTQPHVIVVGGGKTGMDAAWYATTQLKKQVRWIVPTEAWITARENIGSCMELLHTAVDKTKGSLPQAFADWEQQGKVYRMDPNVTPTKFKDATLSKEELDVLRTVPTLRHGRVQRILDDGTLVFVNGHEEALPEGWTVDDTAFIHCSAGAFHCSSQMGAKVRPVFEDNLITVQDVYGTPGFCFCGSIVGKLASMKDLTDAQRNAMCLAPPPSATTTDPLGPSGGDIGELTASHGWVQRLSNLQQWLAVPELREWLNGHRLFNLNQLTLEQVDKLVEETHSMLQSQLKTAG